MKFYFRDRLSGGSLVKIEKDVAVPSHSSDQVEYHPHFKLVYNNTASRNDMLINNALSRVSAPYVALLSPFTIHELSGVTEEQSRINVVYFSEFLVSITNEHILPVNAFKECSNCIFLLSAEQNERLFSLFSLLSDEKCSEAEKKSLLLAFMNSVFRMVTEDKRILLKKTNLYVAEVLDYIHKNISSISKAEDLLGVFHVSFSKLNRDFKKYLGMSVHQILVNYRCLRAIDLLSNTKMKIKDIATSCGFENEYYFYVFFKKQTGRTPSSYRNNASEGD